MEFQRLWNNKKTVAYHTMKKKEKVHGIDCKLKYLKDFKDIYREESGQKEYVDEFTLLRMVFIGITSNNMLSYSQVISSTEQDSLGIQRFEDEALPRNTRIWVPQGELGDYRVLEVRDTFKNEGTFLVVQRLVPVLIDRHEFNDTLGRNLSNDSQSSTQTEKNTRIGRNL